MNTQAIHTILIMFDIHYVIILICLFTRHLLRFLSFGYLKYDKLQGTPPSVCQATDLVPCCFPLAQTISVEQLIKITQNIISFVGNGRGAFSRGNVQQEMCSRKREMLFPQARSLKKGNSLLGVRNVLLIIA